MAIELLREDASPDFSKDVVKNTSEKNALSLSHKISVVARIHRIYANDRRTQVSLIIDASESFSHQLIQKHKELLNDYWGIPTAIQLTQNGVLLKVSLDPKFNLSILKEGMSGVFYIIMIHTSVMPHNTIKDFLIFAKPFSEHEK